MLLKAYCIVSNILKLCTTFAVLIGLAYLQMYSCFLDFDNFNHMILFPSGIQSCTELCMLPELLGCVRNYNFIVWQLHIHIGLLSPTSRCV